MIPLYTLLVLGSIFMQGLFTASEMAFTTMSRIRLKELADKGEVHAVKLERFLKDEAKFIGSTLVGTNIAVVISSTVATRIFAEYFTKSVTPFMTTLVIVPVTLIFAEIIPKVIARQFSMPISLRAVIPLSKFYKAFSPIIETVNFLSGMLLWPFKGAKRSFDRESFTKSDIKKMLLSGYETGEVERDELDLIHKVLDFAKKKSKDIMVPLYKVSSLDSGDSISNLKKLVSVTGFSRIPIYEKNKNDIIGIINIYDILFTEDSEKGSLKDLTRDPVFVNKNDALNIVLARLRHKKQPMGIVTDENSMVLGIITIEDILEEIVGEIEDTR